MEHHSLSWLAGLAGLALTVAACTGPESQDITITATGTGEPGDITITATGTATANDGADSLCDWVEEEVSLDDTLVHWEGGFSYETQPGKIMELLSVPLTGTLTWNGGGDWADITPSEGMTGFSSTLAYGGSTVYRRVPGATGNLALACPRMVRFQTSISMRTDDGVLDETWEAVVSYKIASDSISTEIDVEAVGLVDALQVVPNPDPPIPYHDASYWLPLSYNVYPSSPELPATVSGSLYFRGYFETTRDGDITELSGFNRKLAEWVGFEVQ